MPERCGPARQQGQQGILAMPTTKYFSALSAERNNSSDKQRPWPSPPQQLTVVTASQGRVSRPSWDLQTGRANSRHTAWCRKDRGRVALPVLPSHAALRRVPRHCHACHTEAWATFPVGRGAPFGPHCPTGHGAVLLCLF